MAPPINAARLSQLSELMFENNDLDQYGGRSAAKKCNG